MLQFLLLFCLYELIWLTRIVCIKSRRNKLAQVLGHWLLRWLPAPHLASCSQSSLLWLILFSCDSGYTLFSFWLMMSNMFVCLRQGLAGTHRPVTEQDKTNNPMSCVTSFVFHNLSRLSHMDLWCLNIKYLGTTQVLTYMKWMQTATSTTLSIEQRERRCGNNSTWWFQYFSKKNNSYTRFAVFL